MDSSDLGDTIFPDRNFMFNLPGSSSGGLQIIIAFMLGVLFSPWSYGLLYFLLFLLVYEIILIYFCRTHSEKWCIDVRIGVFAASILGFVIGRYLTGYRHPLDDDHRIGKSKKFSKMS